MVSFQGPKRDLFKLDLIPMINIIFLLLIFFMVTATAMHKQMEVNLPNAKSAKKNTELNATISVGADGSIQLDGQDLTLENLSAELEKKLQGQDQNVVVIRADEDVVFERFGEVIDIAGSVGASDFMLATDLTETVEVNPSE